MVCSTILALTFSSVYRFIQNITSYDTSLKKFKISYVCDHKGTGAYCSALYYHLLSCTIKRYHFSFWGKENKTIWLSYGTVRYGTGPKEIKVHVLYTIYTPVTSYAKTFICRNNSYKYNRWIQYLVLYRTYKTMRNLNMKRTRILQRTAKQ